MQLDTEVLFRTEFGYVGQGGLELAILLPHRLGSQAHMPLLLARSLLKLVSYSHLDGYHSFSENLSPPTPSHSSSLSHTQHTPCPEINIPKESYSIVTVFIYPGPEHNLISECLISTRKKKKDVDYEHMIKIKYQCGCMLSEFK